MDRKPVIIIGAIFFLIGILGFISNPLIGTNALFVANVAHNVFHLVVGALLLIVALKARETTTLWLRVVGAALFLLGLFGVFSTPPAGGALFGFVTTNAYSDWLHLIAGTVLVAGTF